MKKRYAPLLLLVLTFLVIMPIVSAQEYSGFNRFTDNVKLAFSGGDNKVKLALEIREKEVDSAITNSQNQNENKSIQNLEKAKEKLKIVQEKVSLETSEEVKSNTEEIVNKINEDETLPEYFDDYLLEEETTHLTAVLTEKTYEYCSELAKEDFFLMLKDEECNPETAPEPLKDDLEKLKDLQERMFVKLMLEIRSCIDDPGTCNCENNLDEDEKAKCEKMVALAVKCEYKDDENACDELDSMEPEKGDGFAESFVPQFLMNLFREKEGKMISYEIEPSCGVPEECWDENDKPECKQYDYLKETSADWDEYGNFIGHERDCDAGVPSMKESIPQCFDEDDNFLEEKCGKVTVIKNEEGLINYIVEKEIDNVISEFENKSQNTIDKENWTVDENGLEVSNKAREIKQEMSEVKNQIAERTFAPGTYDTEDSGNVVDNDVSSGSQGIAGKEDEENSGKNIVVEGGESSGDDGLKPEVETDAAGDGDNGLEPEVETDVASGGGEIA
jgi:hypothetical protein